MEDDKVDQNGNELIKEAILMSETIEVPRRRRTLSQWFRKYFLEGLLGCIQF
jgi:hypothetical protein